ncbi:sigma-70 family RNA polymerase sigma factor [Dactylosporangium sp. CA-139066]|uniref:sigma-70 family RNA polymerase sigma factor n=1 Tax=Dactylosporangium sp. CA-139066 TaxID=3239930 RepID=UPI003D8D950A
MNGDEWLATHFERHRPRLRAVAYRMLGSLTEADDAVQDTWLRLSRAGTEDVSNLDGWMTTITARVCLNMLRTRSQRREEPFPVHVPDPVISLEGEPQPEEQALLADAVGLALLVVLDTLSPDERLAFVLHDLFAVPFAEIGPLLGRTPAATKQLASRARRRVRLAESPAAGDIAGPAAPDLAQPAASAVVPAVVASAGGVASAVARSAGGVASAVARSAGGAASAGGVDSAAAAALAASAARDVAGLAARDHGRPAAGVPSCPGGADLGGSAADVADLAAGARGRRAVGGPAGPVAADVAASATGNVAAPADGDVVGSGATDTAASAAGNRVRRAAGDPARPAAADLGRQREVVDAFFAAAREGDLRALVAVLHPAVVLRLDAGPARPGASMLLRGPDAVARQAATGIRLLLDAPAAQLRPVVVNGTAGVIVVRDAQPFAVMAFTTTGGAIVEINAITDPARVRAATAAIVPPGPREAM